MSIALTNYIDKNSLPVFGDKIYIRNETSHTQFSKPESLHLIELKEQGLVLEFPHNVCQKGHILTLFFVDQKVELRSRVPDSGTLKESGFHAMAKVENLEERINMVCADLKFTQYDADLWRNILQKFFDHQEMITHTLLKQHKVRDEE